MPAATTTSSTRSRTTDYYALAGIFHSTDLCAGVRNKMGGGGLDYYDTAMLVRAGHAKRCPPRRPRQIDEVERTKSRRPRPSSSAIRGTPEGKRTGPERPAEAAAASS